MIFADWLMVEEEVTWFELFVALKEGQERRRRTEGVVMVLLLVY